MLTRFLLIFCVLSAFLLLGCSNTDTTSNSNSATTNSNKAATSTNTSSTTASTSGDKVGVPECDDYLAKYDACMGKMPEAARAQYKASMDEMRRQWAKMAANPATKAGLVQACKMATDSAKASMKSFGCEF
jgi:hypothetical protein